MNPIMERLTGMHTMTDDVIAMEFPMPAKSGIHNYAMAVTECATPEVKAVLMKQLDESVDTHERIAAYMMQRGVYHPYNVQEQIRLDLKNAQTAMGLPFA